MRTICPGCERPTFWASRRHEGGKRYRQPKPEGMLSAVTADGSCTTCWRDRNGIVREYSSGVTITPATYRNPMSEQETELMRNTLAKMWEARRRRGIPPEGADPTSLARPGLTLMEV